MSAPCLAKETVRMNTRVGELSSERRRHPALRGPRLASLQESPCGSTIRWDKVAAIRKALAGGTYDVDGRLDRTVDKILQTLMV
jgi:hypothetical protein